MPKNLVQAITEGNHTKMFMMMNREEALPFLKKSNKKASVPSGSRITHHDRDPPEIKNKSVHTSCYDLAATKKNKLIDTNLEIATYNKRSTTREKTLEEFEEKQAN